MHDKRKHLLYDFWARNTGEHIFYRIFYTLHLKKFVEIERKKLMTAKDTGINYFSN